MTEPPGRARIPLNFADRVPPPSGNGHAEQDAFGAARGWRPSRSSQPCLRWVAGKRCLMGSRGPCPGCGNGVGFSRILDHPRMWTTGNGGRVLIAEPYDMATETQRGNLEQLTEYARTLGLVVEEFPELSVWYPPYTSLLAVRRADSPIGLPL